ncbi:hypothetical protein [Dactylosporangium sp. NPDC050588]|uniref:hypothetical protein n=1 Tax=Dactylosporangium sp. NPDC050588 TaxID=3157211 RepID=UPI0033EC34DD
MLGRVENRADEDARDVSIICARWPDATFDYRREQPGGKGVVICAKERWPAGLDEHVVHPVDRWSQQTGDPPGGHAAALGGATSVARRIQPSDCLICGRSAA